MLRLSAFLVLIESELLSPASVQHKTQGTRNMHYNTQLTEQTNENVPPGQLWMWQLITSAAPVRISHYGCHNPHSIHLTGLLTVAYKL